MTEPCRPHPVEVYKEANMRAEAETKGVPYEDHPGRKWYLCDVCGSFHRAPAPPIEGSK